MVLLCCCLQLLILFVYLLDFWNIEVFFHFKISLIKFKRTAVWKCVHFGTLNDTNIAISSFIKFPKVWLRLSIPKWFLPLPNIVRVVSFVSLGWAGLHQFLPQFLHVEQKNLHINSHLCKYVYLYWTYMILNWKKCKMHFYITTCVIYSKSSPSSQVCVRDSHKYVDNSLCWTGLRCSSPSLWQVWRSGPTRLPGPQVANPVHPTSPPG